MLGRDDQSIKIVIGDTPRSALSDTFRQEHVEWMIFLPEPDYVGQSLYEIKDIWGEAFMYEVLETMKMITANSVPFLQIGCKNQKKMK